MADSWNATELGSDDVYAGAERVAEFIGGIAGKIVATGKLVGKSLAALHRSDMNELAESATAAMNEGAALAQTTANYVRRAADYLGTHDRRQIARNLGRVVRQHPTEALAVAVAMGFFVDRMMLRRRG